MYMYMCIYTYIYIYIHTYTYIYIYIGDPGRSHLRRGRPDAKRIEDG